MTTQLRSSSRVQVTIEISGSCYGPDWVLGDLVKQSNREALDTLQRKLSDAGLKIIGEPKCIVHSVVEDK